MNLSTVNIINSKQVDEYTSTQLIDKFTHKNYDNT